VEILKYIVIGLLQGLTEFLPVSSSAHIILAEHWLQLNPPGVTLEVSLHMATLLAVVLVYRRDLWRVLSGRDWKLMGMLALATAVTVALVLPFKDWLKAMTESPMAVYSCGWLLIVTAIWLAVADWRLQHPAAVKPLSWSGAVLLGAAQGIAALDGISRSGATIATAILLGEERSAAARFSFLMSVPVILGAGLVDFMDEGFGAGTAGISQPGLVLGSAAALLAGVVAIYLLLWLLRKARLLWFSAYCLVLGVLALLIG
jgi:undecaprenyl-diphosphatase